MQRYFRGKGVYQREDSDDSSNESNSEASDESELEESEQEAPILNVKFQKRTERNERNISEGIIKRKGNDDKEEVDEEEVNEENRNKDTIERVSGSGESSESSESSESESSDQELINMSKNVKFQHKKRQVSVNESKKSKDLQNEKSQRVLKGIKRNISEMDKEDTEKKLREGWGKIEDQIVAHLDDDDDKDRKSEYEAWKKREMARLWKEREEMIKREEMAS